MIERYIKQLKIGDISFLKSLSNIDRENLWNEFRFIPYRKDIIKIIFNDLKNSFPFDAFMITYDIEEYAYYGLEYLEKDFSCLFNNRFFHRFIEESSWGLSFVLKNLDSLLLANLDNIFSILRYALYHNRQDILNRLVNNENIIIREHTMYVILDDFAYYFYNIYSDVESYFKNSKGELMDENYLSKMAILVINNLDDIKLFQVFKEFILRNYNKNTLGSLLDSYATLEDRFLFRELLIEDINRYFVTSKDYKWQLYRDYKDHLSKEIINDFGKRIKPFEGLFYEDVLESISANGLLDEFLKYAYMYLEKSTKTKVISKVGSGTCSYVYRIGDYVIKFSDKKYSMVEDSCPNIYLIIKNYEELIKRNDYGKVTGAIEVQRYLSKPVLITQRDLLAKWREDLEENGYLLEDNLVNGMGGTNCFYLDDYHDADIEDVDSLPEWFKKDPIVLVDRDLVYKIK